MKRGYDRSERVNDLLQKSVAQILLRDMPDTRFRFVTVTGVAVSRDLSHAKIYVSLLLDDEEKIKELIYELNASAKAIRYTLASMVKLRIVPELKFHYDESTARGYQLSALINSAVKKSNK